MCAFGSGLGIKSKKKFDVKISSNNEGLANSVSTSKKCENRGKM